MISETNAIPCDTRNGMMGCQEGIPYDTIAIMGYPKGYHEET